MLITIKAVSIEQRPAKGKGNPYEIAEIIFTDDRSPQVKTFKLVSFSNPQGFTTIKAAKPGDQFDVTVVKGDDGYNKWTTVSPTSQGGGQTPSPSPRSTPQGQAYPSRDFESKEERTTKQRLIVRQSSLAQAVAVLSVGGKAPPKQEEVFALANAFTAYVYEALDLFDQPNDDVDKDIPY